MTIGHSTAFADWRIGIAQSRPISRFAIKDVLVAMCQLPCRSPRPFAVAWNARHARMVGTRAQLSLRWMFKMTCCTKNLYSALRIQSQSLFRGSKLWCVLSSFFKKRCDLRLLLRPLTPREFTKCKVQTFLSLACSSFTVSLHSLNSSTSLLRWMGGHVTFTRIAKLDNNQNTRHNEAGIFVPEQHTAHVYIAVTGGHLVSSVNTLHKASYTAQLLSHLPARSDHDDKIPFWRRPGIF